MMYIIICVLFMVYVKVKEIVQATDFMQWIVVCLYCLHVRVCVCVCVCVCVFVSICVCVMTN